MYTMARSCKRSSPWPTLAMSMGACFAKPVIAVMPRQLSRAAAQPMSASTVMVIGFVSAGLMSLPQAISVIFGANIGTTMTALLASIGQSRNAKRTANVSPLWICCSTASVRC